MDDLKYGTPNKRDDWVPRSIIDTHTHMHHLHHHYSEMNHAGGARGLDKVLGSWHDGEEKRRRLRICAALPKSRG